MMEIDTFKKDIIVAWQTFHNIMNIDTSQNKDEIFDRVISTASITW